MTTFVVIAAIVSLVVSLLFWLVCRVNDIEPVREDTGGVRVNDELPPGCGPAVDLTGHPGHDALRQFWQVPPGGYRRPQQPPKGVPGDVLTNLLLTSQRRNAALTADYDERARRAWDAYCNGAGTRREVAKLAGISERVMLKRWIAMRFITR
jgi:hypothetical protein